jgi:hypothetical protein
MFQTPLILKFAYIEEKGWSPVFQYIRSKLCTLYTFTYAKSNELNFDTKWLYVFEDHHKQLSLEFDINLPNF